MSRLNKVLSKRRHYSLRFLFLIDKEQYTIFMPYEAKFFLACIFGVDRLLYT